MSFDISKSASPFPRNSPFISQENSLRKEIVEK